MLIRASVPRYGRSLTKALTLQEAAERLGYKSAMSIRRLAKRGELIIFKLPTGSPRVREVDIDKLIQRCYGEEMLKREARQRRRRRGPLPCNSSPANFFDD